MAGLRKDKRDASSQCELRSQRVSVEKPQSVSGGAGKCESGG